MSDHEPSFATFSRSYRPWGQVRRKNLIARLVHTLGMTLLGLAVLAAFALLILFAASLAVIGVAVLALITISTLIARSKPARIFVRAEKPKADGLFEAKKSGSTWIVY